MLQTPIKKEIKKEDLVPSLLYLSQPSSLVIIDGKKKLLNLDMENALKQVWLVKLPRFLAGKLHDTEKIGGREIGKLLLDKKQADARRFKFVLDQVPDEHGNDVFGEVPHNYDFRVTNVAAKNEYVFSERNLENYGSRHETIGGGIEKDTSSRRDVFREKRLDTDNYVQFAKTIPKKTALVGTVCHECTVTPSPLDPNYHQVLKERKVRETLRPGKPEVELLKETGGIIQGFVAPSLKNNDILNVAFIKANRENRAKEGNRAIRMERQELLDVLFKLFDEHDYWALKVIKERVRQPDAWLKECLEGIALVVKRGPYALKYGLKPEFKKIRDEERRARREAAGEIVDDNNGDEDDDEMEDVQITRT